MKKYLLLLGCVCIVLSAFADDTALTKSRSSFFTDSAFLSIVTRIAISDPVTNGGKPRLPEKPRSTNPGNVAVRNGSFSGNSLAKKDDPREWTLEKVDLVGFHIDPLGGKPRDKGRPLGITPGGVVVAGGAKKLTIDDVTSLIDQLLTEGQSSAKNISDVTTLIDQLLTQPE